MFEKQSVIWKNSRKSMLCKELMRAKSRALTASRLKPSTPSIRGVAEPDRTDHDSDQAGGTMLSIELLGELGGRYAGKMGRKPGSSWHR